MGHPSETDSGGNPFVIRMRLPSETSETNESVFFVFPNITASFRTPIRFSGDPEKQRDSLFFVREKNVLLLIKTVYQKKFRVLISIIWSSRCPDWIFERFRVRPVKT
jgi:hypothetical protein